VNEMRLLLFSLLAGLLCPLLFSALPPWQPFAFGFVVLLSSASSGSPACYGVPAGLLLGPVQSSAAA